MDLDFNGIHEFRHEETSMSIERNKATAMEFFAKFSANDVNGAMGLASDDFTWWTAGKPEKLPVAGLMDKEKFLGLMGMLGGMLPDGIRVDPLILTAEGDRVAVEAVSYAKTTTGRIYNNEYHFLLHFTPQGKVKAVKEYLDTMHVKETFID
jgi:ketosteroid isomerase-like protein